MLMAATCAGIALTALLVWLLYPRPTFRPEDHIRCGVLPAGTDFAQWAADRIVAPPGIKAYGAISVLLGAAAEAAWLNGDLVSAEHLATRGLDLDAADVDAALSQAEDAWLALAELAPR